MVAKAARAGWCSGGCEGMEAEAMGGLGVEGGSSSGWEAVGLGSGAAAAEGGSGGGCRGDGGGGEDELGLVLVAAAACG